MLCNNTWIAIPLLWRENRMTLHVQTITHWMQHPMVATYPEVTIFSCNQTELTIKVGICCNFLSERLTQWLQLFALNLPFFPSFFPDFLKNFWWFWPCEMQLCGSNKVCSKTCRISDDLSHVRWAMFPGAHFCDNSNIFQGLISFYQSHLRKYGPC